MTTMSNGDITMDDDNEFAHWSEPVASSFDDFMNPPEPSPTAEALKDSRTADPKFLEEKPRSRKAIDYEKKAQNVVRFAIKGLLMNPATIQDGAVLIQYGPDFCEAAGNFAAENAWVSKTIEMMNDGTENATLAFIAATAPIALQMMRNHEPAIEATPHREIKIPFTKRVWKLKVKVRLPWRMRAFTEDPSDFTKRVLTAPGVAEALEKQGIRIVIG